MVAAWINAETGVGRSNEQQQAQEGHGVNGTKKDEIHRLRILGGSGHLEHLGIVQGAEYHIDGEDTQGETEVADPVDQKGLHGGIAGRLLLEPEADEKIGGQAHTLPAEEELEEVVAGHQHQHGEGDKGEVAEKSRIMGILFHITDGVDVDQGRDAGDDDQHGRCDTVDQDAEVHLEITGDDPGEDLLTNHLAITHGDLEKYRNRQRRRDRHA